MQWYKQWSEFRGTEAGRKFAFRESWQNRWKSYMIFFPDCTIYKMAYLSVRNVIEAIQCSWFQNFRHMYRYYMYLYL